MGKDNLIKELIKLFEDKNKELKKIQKELQLIDETIKQLEEN